MTAKYTVSIAGTSVGNIKATDLSIYAEGDWVFLMTPTGQGCSNCNDPPSKTNPPDLSPAYFIVPYRINGIGPS